MNNEVKSVSGKKRILFDFDGEENEKEFLEKIYLQWTKACQCKNNFQKLIMISSAMSEVRHRIREKG